MLYKSIKPPLVEAVQVNESADVTTPGGVVHVNAGDWLVRDPQGNVVRCDDINFKCTYERLETSASVTDQRESKPWGC